MVSTVVASAARNEPPPQPVDPSPSSSPDADDRSDSFDSSPNHFSDTEIQSPDVLKSEEYRQLFRLPPEEVLIEDFNCALQENILIQGHMYLFVNFICFYSNIFGFETKRIIPFPEVTAVRRAKTAGLFPNAIEILAGNRKHFFASFLSRDEAFKIINDGWLRQGNGAREISEQKIIFNQSNSQISCAIDWNSALALDQATPFFFLLIQVTKLPPRKSYCSFQSSPVAIISSTYTNDTVIPLEESISESSNQENGFLAVENVRSSDILDNESLSTASSRDMRLPSIVRDDPVLEDSGKQCSVVQVAEPELNNDALSVSWKWNEEDIDAPTTHEAYTCVADSVFPIKVEDFFRYFFSDAAVNFLESFHKRCGDKDFKCASWHPQEKFGYARELSFQHPIKLYL
ncbi:Protein VASCULAR ASSOCIATED DEATH 1, chloroplastic, partial [Mucuna pruriens]